MSKDKNTAMDNKSGSQQASSGRPVTITSAIQDAKKSSGGSSSENKK